MLLRIQKVPSSLVFSRYFKSCQFCQIDRLIKHIGIDMSFRFGKKNFTSGLCHGIQVVEQLFWTRHFMPGSTYEPRIFPDCAETSGSG
jgi:hypothetical protein